MLTLRWISTSMILRWSKMFVSRGCYFLIVMTMIIVCRYLRFGLATPSSVDQLVPLPSSLATFTADLDLILLLSASFRRRIRLLKRLLRDSPSCWRIIFFCTCCYFSLNWMCSLCRPAAPGQLCDRFPNSNFFFQMRVSVDLFSSSDSVLW